MLPRLPALGRGLRAVRVDRRVHRRCRAGRPPPRPPPRAAPHPRLARGRHCRPLLLRLLFARAGGPAHRARGAGRAPGRAEWRANRQRGAAHATRRVRRRVCDPHARAAGRAAGLFARATVNIAVACARLRAPAGMPRHTGGTAWQGICAMTCALHALANGASFNSCGVLKSAGRPAGPLQRRASAWCAPWRRAPSSASSPRAGSADPP
mmetsp:Transcript_2737/g.8494  ORF Transcript_2737/g.8494 Transcript_2737/m.8494 type:complete len:209 (-) Transcript_2737:398-1024(-)